MELLEKQEDGLSDGIIFYGVTMMSGKSVNT